MIHAGQNEMHKQAERIREAELLSRFHLTRPQQRPYQSPSLAAPLQGLIFPLPLRLTESSPQAALMHFAACQKTRAAEVDLPYAPVLPGLSQSCQLPSCRQHPRMCPCQVLRDKQGTLWSGAACLKGASKHCHLVFATVMQRQ